MSLQSSQKNCGSLVERRKKMTGDDYFLWILLKKNKKKPV